MDKKERKRDIAVFANMIKDLMNEPLDDQLITLDRDLQYFIYGRIAIMVKHNEDKPVGSIGDLGAVVGSALAEVIQEFTRNKLPQDHLEKGYLDARENFIRVFDLKTPKSQPVETNDSKGTEQ